jgi:hypothetical protein
MSNNCSKSHPASEGFIHTNFGSASPAIFTKLLWPLGSAQFDGKKLSLRFAHFS